MGDAGSLSIGFALAFVAISITQAEGSVVSPVAALLIMAVPVVDTVTLMIKRAINGKSPFSPDTKHFHHILIGHGFSKRNSVAIILFISLIFSIIAIWGTVYSIPEHYLFLIFSIYFVSYFVASFHIEHVFGFIFGLMNRGRRTQYGGVLAHMKSAETEETERAKVALTKRVP
jgi:UDP-GlcNAc:undecaprenyl-phosphate GlcNAc-1-phosphate transferase